MRLALILTLLPLLAAAAAAQEPAKAPADELVAKLGDDSYEVREKATEGLIALGAGAIPALERALESEDLEVRLRAGRALRAIRSGRGARSPKRAEGEDRDVPRNPDSQLREGVQVRGVQVQIENGKVKVTLRTVEDGQEKTTVYEGESLEQLKKEHPELNKVLGGTTLRFGFGGRGGQLDDFWKKFDEEMKKNFDQDFWKGFDRGDNRWKEWEQERKRMLEQMRKAQRGREAKGWHQAPRENARHSRTPLGAEVRTLDGALRAQLDLDDGLVVVRVFPGSVAERLGLEQYDILLSLNGRRIAGAGDVRTALGALQRGDEVRAVVLRRAQRKELRTPARAETQREDAPKRDK